MNRRFTLTAIGAIATLVVAVALVACGEDDETTGGATAQTDAEFVAAMVPHHESAIEMAEVAQERAEHREIADLADAIVETQSSEIDLLEVDYERITGEPLDQSGATHGTMGLSEEETGMAMDADLEQADPFDRAFIDAMIPHHQGAIRMARIELEQGEDPELREIAEAIIDAQSREIEQMNEWRERWYGEPSPAGGVPPMGEEMPSGETMGGGTMSH